jgi:hypothetical protein
MYRKVEMKNTKLLNDFLHFFNYEDNDGLYTQDNDENYLCMYFRALHSMSILLYQIFTR